MRTEPSESAPPHRATAESRSRCAPVALVPGDWLEPVAGAPLESGRASSRTSRSATRRSTARELVESVAVRTFHHRGFDEDLVGISPDDEVRVASLLLEGRCSTCAKGRLRRLSSYRGGGIAAGSRSARGAVRRVRVSGLSAVSTEVPFLGVTAPQAASLGSASTFSRPRRAAAALRSSARGWELSASTVSRAVARVIPT